MTSFAPTPVQGDPTGVPLAGDPIGLRRRLRVALVVFFRRGYSTRQLPSRRAGSALTLVTVAALALVVQLLGAGAVEQGRDQQVLYDQLRSELANGTAPVGPLGFDGKLVAPGAPVALLEIPRLHVRQVVVNGTSSSATTHGPGHRRDSVMPGQRGVSIVMGRSASYGAPFAHIGELAAGDVITVTTGQGIQSFAVIGSRRAGDPAPPFVADQGRLLLMTADGAALVPTGVLRVDAVLTSAVQDAAAPLAAASLSSSEQPMGVDSSHIFALILWLQLMLAVSLFAVWATVRWGRWPAWLAAGPVLVFVGFIVAEHASQLLPNLL